MTAVITGERGDGTLTRQGLEEYVSDCVILLDHRVHNQISTRRLRIVKYRGTAHGTNEYPFLIDEDGFSVLPVSPRSGSTTRSSRSAISTGVPDLDAMLSGGGFHRGSSVLLTGVAGLGQDLAAASICRCRLQARRAGALFLVRGIRRADRAQHALDRHRPRRNGSRSASCAIVAARPTFYSLEMHLAMMLREIAQVQAAAGRARSDLRLHRSGDMVEVQSMLLRIVDFLKSNGITAVFTHLMQRQQAARPMPGCPR